MKWTHIQADVSKYDLKEYLFSGTLLKSPLPQNPLLSNKVKLNMVKWNSLKKWTYQNIFFCQSNKVINKMNLNANLIRLTSAIQRY